ncbi:MAG: formate dehydrogenase accessory sulfurtransferase FdhD [Burkholderiaceae bacterium]|nr:formate dehydrogenase accessory sulfurtransferase FdhD [Burkholderiaceae bacterium]
MKSDGAALRPAGASQATVTPHRAGGTERSTDWLADEVPVALVFNGISHAVMLATPADLDDFALGFGLTEGLLAHASELQDVEVHETSLGIEVRMEVAGACEFRLKERRRNLTGRTGCGLCGTESLEHVHRALPEFQLSSRRIRIAPAAVGRALRSLRAAQALQQSTGAAHAAAWCSPDGEALLVREDIGRHNALDKLAGAMSRTRVDASQGFVCVTSRASFEMVQKTAMIGASMLVAVSAPTALAVRIADGAGMALAGFARHGDFVAYTAPERFGLTPVAPLSTD